jgi:drug/metabolite transporter (DMT)-like permease
MTFRKNGVLLLLLADLFFALIPITVRMATRSNYSPAQVTFFRFAFAVLGIMALVKWGGAKLKIVNFRALFWRGLFGGLSVLFYFLALHFTTAAKGTLLNYTYSIWANVFAVVFLRQKPPKGFVPLLLLAVTGVWLVLGVSFETFNWGDLIGTLAGAMAGAATLAVKEARKTDDSLSVFGSFTFFGLLISMLLLGAGPLLGPSAAPLLGWNPLTGEGWVILLAMGAVSMTAQLLFTEGFGYASLHTGTLLSLLVPVGAALLGLLFLGEPLTPHFLLGTALVLTACGYFGWQCGKAKSHENDRF